ncbi:ATP-binding protein [Coleofasciculus sp. FACHB-T130]|uniref:ATP-binding protein n=1 Tax=Cyanophyceae TaxID=3028117 RepID=UPI0016865F10|nr:ATP-binding protein [Coleofasciculus sp. FACHB-T130]MBD1881259.1 ATP-binding protein [Coleofasciculus sp. FACHB-T130]
MNNPPRSPTPLYTPSYAAEFQQTISEKSANFVGRHFVFTAIEEFLHKCDRGYFTIVGAPGSGKSAILAKYVTENPGVAYYKAQIAGKNRADRFLASICQQLMATLGEDTALPDNATEGSWFLSLLLQKISDSLPPNQKLITVIDGLDAIDPSSQPPGSNLFYLPRYLPEKIYFLLARRPFIREKSGLLIETPSQILTLEKYPDRNREDVQAYIRQCLTPLGKEGTRMKEGIAMEESSERNSPSFLRDLKSWLITHNISEQEFCDRLAPESENNFAYLSQIIKAIATGFYSQPFQFDPFHPGLTEYYQSHWQNAIAKRQVNLAGESIEPLPSVDVAVLNILVQAAQPISAEAIARIIDEDEYEVEEVLENWIEFLQQQQIGGATCYCLYHSSFRNWLGKQLNLS